MNTTTRRLTAIVAARLRLARSSFVSGCQRDAGCGAQPFVERPVGATLTGEGSGGGSRASAPAAAAAAAATFTASASVADSTVGDL